MKLKTPNKDDLRIIAECRRIIFPDSIASKLGNGYLIKIFEMYLTVDNYFLFYIEENRQCIGYCSGTLDTIQITGLGATSSMVHYAFWNGVLSLVIRPWLIFQIGIIKKWKFVIIKVIERIKKILMGKYYEIDQVNNLVKTAWIVDIGVHPNYRRLGIGSKLLVEFDNKVREFGLLRGGLSVEKSNLGAIKAYKKHGWKVNDVGNSSYFMTKDYKYVIY